MQRKNNTQPQSNKAEKKNQYFELSEPKNQSFLEKKIVALEETMNMQWKNKKQKNAYKCKYIEVNKENIEEDGEGKQNTSKPHQEG